MHSVPNIKFNVQAQEKNEDAGVSQKNGTLLLLARSGDTQCHCTVCFLNIKRSVTRVLAKGVRGGGGAAPPTLFAPLPPVKKCRPLLLSDFCVFMPFNENAVESQYKKVHKGAFLVLTQVFAVRTLHFALQESYFEN